MAPTSPSIPIGTIVEYQADRDLQCAMIIDNAGGKVRILLSGKKELKISPSRILGWTGPLYPQNLSRPEAADKVDHHENLRRTIRDDIDTLELWELAGGEMRDAAAKWFAALLWDSPDSDQIAAMGRALMNDRMRFKFNAGLFEIMSREDVDARLKAARAEEERQAFANQGQKLFKSLWSAYQSGTRLTDPSPIDPEYSVFAEMIREKAGLAPENTDKKRESLWNLAIKGLPQLDRLPEALARAWNLVPWHHNPLANTQDYIWGNQWCQEWKEQISQLRSQIEEKIDTFSDAVDYQEIPLVSIDSASTRDLDDALWVEEKADGSFRVLLALARPDFNWPFGSDLDQAAMFRASSVYLPDGTSHMLPESLATGCFSLQQDSVRPSLFVEARTDSLGNTREIKLQTGFTRVQANITYTQAEALLNPEGEFAGSLNELPDSVKETITPSLKAGFKLAELLRKSRIHRGAAIFDKADCSLQVEGLDMEARVLLQEPANTPGAELLVSEMMILANSCVATWADQQNIPLIYRTQPLSVPEDFAGIWTDPVDIYRRVRILTSTLLEVEPRPHVSLGLDRYCTVTSPIRRYTDLVNMSQVSRAVQNEPFRSAEELKNLLLQLTGSIAERGKIQKWGDRYWKLVLIAQDKNRSWKGVMVDQNQYYSLIALGQLQMNVRAQSHCLQGELKPGSRVEVTFARIDPLFEEIKVATVRPCEMD